MCYELNSRLEWMCNIVVAVMMSWWLFFVMVRWWKAENFHSTSHSEGSSHTGLWRGHVFSWYNYRTCESSSHIQNVFWILTMWKNLFSINSAKKIFRPPLQARVGGWDHKWLFGLDFLRIYSEINFLCCDTVGLPVFSLICDWWLCPYMDAWYSLCRSIDNRG